MKGVSEMHILGEILYYLGLALVGVGVFAYLLDLLEIIEIRYSPKAAFAVLTSLFLGVLCGGIGVYILRPDHFSARWANILLFLSGK